LISWSPVLIVYRPKYTSYLQGIGPEPITIFQEQANLSRVAAEEKRTLQPSFHHSDSILDLKMIEMPHKMLISCSRDGIVKVWK
jgi:hypothetical protein